MKCIFSLFCILFLSIAQTTGFVPRQPIINRGDLYVSNNLAANSIKIIGRDSFFKCHNLYSKNLITSNYNSQFVKGNNLYLKNIYPYKGDSTYVLLLFTVYKIWFLNRFWA